MLEYIAKPRLLWTPHDCATSAFDDYQATNGELAKDKL